MSFIKLNNHTTLFRFFLLIPFVWFASKWGEDDHWCTNQTLSLISRFEGFFSKTYLCPAGVSTIGFGHVVEDGENFSGIHLAQDEALKLLRSDLISANDIRPYLKNPDSLEPHQLDAITSLTYNMGHPEIGRSLLVKHINENNIEAFDPKSSLLPSVQWDIPLKYTDENWKMLRKIDARGGSSLLEEAVKIFYEYQASRDRRPKPVK